MLLLGGGHQARHQMTSKRTTSSSRHCRRRQQQEGGGCDGASPPTPRWCRCHVGLCVRVVVSSLNQFLGDSCSNCGRCNTTTRLQSVRNGRPPSRPSAGALPVHFLVWRRRGQRGRPFSNTERRISGHVGRRANNDPKPTPRSRRREEDRSSLIVFAYNRRTQTQEKDKTAERPPSLINSVHYSFLRSLDRHRIKTVFFSLDRPLCILPAPCRPCFSLYMFDGGLPKQKKIAIPTIAPCALSRHIFIPPQTNFT